MSNVNHQQKFACFLLLISVLGVATGSYILDQFLYEILYHRAYPSIHQARPFLVAIFTLSHLIFWTLSWRIGNISCLQLAKATSPLSFLCLYPLIHDTGMIWGMYLMLTLSSISFYQIARQWEKTYQGSWRITMFFAIILTLIVTLWTILFQHSMYSRLLLGYPDIGIYYKRIWNTIQYGEFHRIHSDALQFQYHFSPGLLLLLPLMAIHPTVDFFIVIQCLFLCGTGMVLFYLVRAQNRTAYEALGITLCYLLYPATTQQTYCYSYGFHPPTIALPFLILSLYWGEKEYYRRALLTGIIACSMQEHVCIYYFGMGTVWLWQKKYYRGIIVMMLSLSYFFIATKVMIPRPPGKTAIEAVHIWGHLGQSMFDVVLSPFTNSKKFFSSLFNPHNLHLLIQLILPLFFLLICAPRYVLGLWPVFLFNFIRNDLASKCIAFQYQTLSIGILFLGCIMTLSPNQKDQQSRKKFCFLQPSRAHLWTAVWTSFFASFFLGLVPWAKQNNGIVSPAYQQQKNYRALEDIKNLIPLEASVTADRRTMILFLSHRLVMDYQDERNIKTEYHVYQEKYWNSSPNMIHKQVDKVMKSGYRLIYKKHGFYVLKSISYIPPLSSSIF